MSVGRDVIADVYDVLASDVKCETCGRCKNVIAGLLTCDAWNGQRVKPTGFCTFFIPADKSCSTCRHFARRWSEEPCDSCTMGGETNHWERAE